MRQLRTHYSFTFNRTMSTDMEHERMLKQLLAKRDDSNDFDLFQGSFRLPLVHEAPVEKQISVIQLFF